MMYGEVVCLAVSQIQTPGLVEDAAEEIVVDRRVYRR